MKLIVTVPAFAVSVLLVNFRAPDGSAAIESELLAVPEDGAAEVLDVAGELAAVVLLAGGVAAALLLLLLLPLEPPQALMPSARAIATSVNLGVL
ncbi:MAG: hypothetical protein ACRDPA_14275, partial [Solirubrobacteraceae bacterium]